MRRRARARGDRDDAEAALDTRLAAIEAKLDSLATLTSQPMASHTATPSVEPGLLVGWWAIARYCQKAPRTLRRYANRETFPAFRWGRHVVTSPDLISRWLLIREQNRLRRPRVSPDGP